MDPAKMADLLYVVRSPGPARVDVSGAVHVFHGGMLCTVELAGRLGSLEGWLMQEHIGYGESGGQDCFPKLEKSPRVVGGIAVAVVPLTVSLKAKCRSQGHRIAARRGDLVLHRILQLLENMAVGSHCQLPT